MAAGLTWEVQETLEANGKPVKEEKKYMHEGRKIFDDVVLFHPSEKDGFRNRRILIAKRLGLLPDTKQAVEITKRMWAEETVGCEVILTTEERSWKDSKTEEIKKATSVTFDGYTSVTGASSESSSDEDYEDI